MHKNLCCRRLSHYCPLRAYLQVFNNTTLLGKVRKSSKMETPDWQGTTVGLQRRLDCSDETGGPYVCTHVCVWESVYMCVGVYTHVCVSIHRFTRYYHAILNIACTPIPYSVISLVWCSGYHTAFRLAYVLSGIHGVGRGLDLKIGSSSKPSMSTQFFCCRRQNSL